MTQQKKHSSSPLVAARRTMLRLPARGLLIALAVLLLASIAIVQFGSSPTSASSASLRVDAPVQARVGQPFQVSLWVRDAGSIAGYEAMVLFDTEAATFRGVEHRNNELNRMGRDVQTIGPDEIPGGMAIGAYSCSFQHCVEIDGLAKQQRGASGLVRLSTFTIVPERAGSLTIEIGSPVFVDVDGAVINVALEQTTITLEVEEGMTGE